MDHSRKIIDGKAIAAQLHEEIAQQVKELQKNSRITPGLTVFLVGDNPASQVYVNKKAKTSEEVGIESRVVRLPADTTTAALKKAIDAANQDIKTHGILVQLPLPKQINTEEILDYVSPDKDVDGFHPYNTGLLYQDRPRFVPCTPLGILKLLKAKAVPIEGQHAVVIGRSHIVGKPIAQLLLRENATVTLCHSRTRDLPEILKSADIVVAAVGKANFVQGKDLKPGCVVIDVGINRSEAGKLIGDVHFESAVEKARLITPVPGGVGPMTIACLLENTLNSARWSVQKNKGDSKRA